MAHKVLGILLFLTLIVERKECWALKNLRSGTSRTGIVLIILHIRSPIANTRHTLLYLVPDLHRDMVKYIPLPLN